MRKLAVIALAAIVAATPVTVNAAGYTPSNDEKNYCLASYEEDSDKYPQDTLVKDHYGNQYSLSCRCLRENKLYTISNAIDIDPSKKVHIISESSTIKPISVYLGKKVKTIKRVKSDGYNFKVAIKRSRSTGNITRVIVTRKGASDNYGGEDKFNCYDAKKNKIGSFTIEGCMLNPRYNVNTIHQNESEMETIDVDWPRRLFER